MTIVLSFSATAQSFSKTKLSEVTIMAKTDELSVSKADFIEFGKLYKEYISNRTDVNYKTVLAFYLKMVEKAGSNEKLYEISKNFFVPTCYQLCDQAFNMCMGNCCFQGLDCCWDNYCYMRRLGCISGCEM